MKGLEVEDKEDVEDEGEPLDFNPMVQKNRVRRSDISLK